MQRKSAELSTDLTMLNWLRSLFSTREHTAVLTAELNMWRERALRAEQESGCQSTGAPNDIIFWKKPF